MRKGLRCFLRIFTPCSVTLFLFMLVSCGSDTGEKTSGYTPTEATPGTPVINYADITTASLNYTNAVIISSTLIVDGTVVSGIAMPEHARVTGTLNERTSSVDGKNYAIGFEMRLPTNWNGRYYYQGNGGMDGRIVSATGSMPGGGATECALSKGFAVISSDAGHTSEAGTIGGGLFGIDPQARVDYGYNAVGQLTPMAKALIKLYYGRGPDKSYIGGTSNGGRHAMVAASRFGDQYDGFLVSNPGFNLPRAAVAQLWGVQQYATIATGTTPEGRPDITTALTATDLAYLAGEIVNRCDALDGAADDLVSDIEGCQEEFDIDLDTETCPGAPDGTCLTVGQKYVLTSVHKGARDSSHNNLYTNFPWDRGISSSGWRTWKYSNSTGNRDPLSVAFAFMTPPVSPTLLDGTGTTLLDFALDYSGAATPRFNVDTDAPKINATDSTYTESAMSFMTPPDLMMSKMVANHGRMILLQGATDPVFSVQDTINWFKSFRTYYGDAATASMARLFIVPGMGHSSGGPATDYYGTGTGSGNDVLDKIVAWVEKGIAPDSIIAIARGVGGTITSTNSEVPASWNPNRTRPLCPYPKVAKYVGTDANYEIESNFACQ
ncbi:MAG: tannase/feruloyl esterase family alpha/beta hydrolase [Spirochaetales bacterium]|nr:tannase/feruloyl esterase family alpha/beta hydrolase [Spirochaetales bacterium]